MNPIVEPRVYFIDDIMVMMSKGRLLMPDFQRKYVWSKEKITELFDSIYKGFPIGSVLLWSPEENIEINCLEYLGNQKIARSDDAFYIIDGQQRLTTFFMCLFSHEPNEDTKWNVYFDLKSEKFVHLKSNKSDIKPYYLEIRKIKSTSLFMQECLRIKSETNDDDLINRAQTLVDRIYKFRLAAIDLRGGEIEQAIEIFTRLNREGQKVSEWDYVRALSKKDKAKKLNFVLDEVEDILSREMFSSENDKSINLKIIQTSFNFPLYDSVWKQVSEKINDADEYTLSKIIDSLEKTIYFCKKNLFLRKISDFPYSNQFYMLLVHFINNDNIDLERLENEFYFAAINEIPKTNPSSVDSLISYYSSGFDRENLNSKLLQQYEKPIPTPIEERFSAKSAKSKILFNILRRKEITENCIECNFYYPPIDINKGKHIRNRLGNKLFVEKPHYYKLSLENLESKYQSLYMDFINKIFSIQADINL
ncbi:DUF262 domain-containing protein [Vibrio splendidus]